MLYFYVLVVALRSYKLLERGLKKLNITRLMDRIIGYL